MARNSQRTDRRHMVCENCRMDFCENCVDVMLLAVGRKGFCQCTRKGHSGEPNEKQILDPESGSVFTPGLEITQDGEVKRL